MDNALTNLFAVTDLPSALAAINELSSDMVRAA